MEGMEIKNQKMEQKYGLPVAVSLIVGVVIGIGIFFKAESVLGATEGNKTLALLAWVVASTLTVLGGLTVAEISSSTGETGGIIDWMKRIYGRKLAFVVGWANAVIYAPSIIAVIAYYMAEFCLVATGSLPLIGTSTHIIISFSGLILVFIVNTFTKKSGGILQLIFTIAKLVPIILIVTMGVVGMSEREDIDIFEKNIYQESMMDSELSIDNVDKLDSSDEVDVAERVEGSTSNVAMFLSALVAVMFAFDGWVYAGNMAGEIKDYKKKLPLAIILGLSFIGVIYVLINLVIFGSVSSADILASGTPGAAGVILGAGVAKFFFYGVIVSAIGGLNGFFLVSSRTPYILSKDELFPDRGYFSKVNHRFEQPVRSCVLIFIISSIYLGAMFVVPNRDIFSEIPVALFWLFYSFLFVGVIVLRKNEPNLERHYKVPLYPVVPLLATLGGFVVAITSAVKDPLYQLGTLGIILIGFVFWHYAPKKKIS